MISLKVKEEETYIGRFEHDSEGVGELRSFAEEHDLNSAVFSIIGAVKSATIGFYDQERHEYMERDMEEPMEIVYCFGNICSKDGQPLVHAHICLSSEDGRTVGGHLVAMRVFAAELYLRSFVNAIRRTPDETTGLHLMDIE